MPHMFLGNPCVLSAQATSTRAANNDVESEMMALRGAKFLRVIPRRDAGCHWNTLSSRRDLGFCGGG